MPFKEGENPTEKSKPASFAELAKQKDVTPAELIATLRDYAERGDSIDDRVVLGIIKRVKLTPEEKTELVNLARIGIDRATSSIDVAEYKSIIRYFAIRANDAHLNDLGNKVKKIMSGTEKD